MKRPRTTWRRGEGHVEYVVITTMIMVCAVVALFNFFDAAKQVALDKKVCIDCYENGTSTVDDLDADNPPPPRPRTADEVIDDERYAGVRAAYPFATSVARVIGSVLGSSHVVAFMENMLNYLYDSEVRFAGVERAPPASAFAPA